jgi:hypothetical protein
VGYKDLATDTTRPGSDPMWHVNNAIVTTNWRADPVNNPENAIISTGRSLSFFFCSFVPLLQANLRMLTIIILLLIIILHRRKAGQP